VAKYGKWQANNDPFLETNSLLIAFGLCQSYWGLLRRKAEGLFKKNAFFQRLNITNFATPILIFVALLIFYRNPKCLFVMDDLSLLITLFLIHFTFRVQ
jgi:hypothetical protein